MSAAAPSRQGTPASRAPRPCSPGTARWPARFRRNSLRFLKILLFFLLPSGRQIAIGRPVVPHAAGFRPQRAVFGPGGLPFHPLVPRTGQPSEGLAMVTTLMRRGAPIARRLHRTTRRAGPPRLEALETRMLLSAGLQPT